MIAENKLRRGGCAGERANIQKVAGALLRGIVAGELAGAGLNLKCDIQITDNRTSYARSEIHGEQNIAARRQRLILKEPGY